MNMMTTESLIDPMNFQKGNELYRQGAFEQAASFYVKALNRYSGFKPIYVNLALSLRKIENNKVCEQLLRDALEIVRPGEVDNDITLVKNPV